MSVHLPFQSFLVLFPSEFVLHFTLRQETVHSVSDGQRERHLYVCAAKFVGHRVIQGYQIGPYILSGVFGQITSFYQQC